MGANILGQITKEYLTKFPKTSTRTLAGMMLRDNPQVFKDYEQARYQIRMYRGAAGKKMRAIMSNKSHYRITESHNPFDLPEPDESRQVMPFKFPKDLRNTLIISDTQIPYHDLSALTIALEYGRKNKIDSLIINGDFMDFFAISRFLTDPRKRDLSNEITETTKMLEAIDGLFPKGKVRKFFKLGNHEERWEKYLWLKAPELCGVEMFEFENILQFEKYGYEKIEGRAEITYNKYFTILHGHEMDIPNPHLVNPARSLYLKWEDNALVSHFHRPSFHTQKSGNGKIRATYSIGCLCLLRPEFSTVNKWVHGFAHLTREHENEYHVKNFMVVNGQIYEG